MPDITTAYNWAIQKCNDSNVGYSQSYRNEQTVNGITYYDCSSFIWYALKAGGFDVVGAFEEACWGYEGNAITTDYEAGWLIALGFKEVDWTAGCIKGDVLWRSGHTEMVFEGGAGKARTMGAHSANYALEDQVSINDTFSSNWARCFRYGGGADPEPETPIIPDWIYGNRYLSKSEMENNATIIFYNLDQRGWTAEAIAGFLGNVQQESTVNPALWQSFKENNMSVGYGLVQWTPATNYINWANENGYSITDGDAQLKWVDEVTVPFGQWIKTSAYPISFDEYRKSTASVEYLVTAFLKNFERAGTEMLEDRISYGKSWYEFIKNLPAGGGGGIIPTPTPKNKKRKGYNFILMNRRSRVKIL